jgi:hypothetical protein
MNTMTKMEGRAADWLAQDYRRRAERDAIRRAYAAFALYYRRWANSLFDLTFLAAVPPETLEQGDAARLAEAYVAQLTTYDKSALNRRSVQMALPVAAAFLQLRAKERGRYRIPIGEQL